MDGNMDKVYSSSTALPAYAEEEEEGKNKLATMKKRLQRLSDWFGRRDVSSPPTSPKQEELSSNPEEVDGAVKPGLVRRLSKRVVTELPRPGTFRRQLSERREHLTPHQPSLVEPRAVSVERRRAVSAPQTSPVQPPRLPELPSFSTQLLSDDADGTVETTVEAPDDLDPLQWDEKLQQQQRAAPMSDLWDGFDRPDDDPPPPFSPLLSDAGWASSEGIDEAVLNEELEKRWILNLSMHFRDKSDREKFFVTYAETPTKWRRLTVSCDYRNAPLDSLERDLKGMRYQRDKSARIFESIRESLPEVQFYDTVTNLKLETGDDGRLHVHVTEDVNEIITYPSTSIVTDLGCPTYKESSVDFDSHLSGFVYKVKIDGQVWIKKEIPGPDAVDEFLYEVQALHTLKGSDGVISFGGVVVDDEGRHIIGLLIGFAERGALVDILYEEKGRIPWSRRERWAHQIVQGLNEIHEAGFVQGDLTLSNVVVDGNDDAKIIDINRRGCPVGWEPPEMKALIANRLKVGMFIGVKSDLFQLGMVLWALATQNDEPELQRRPLTLTSLLPREMSGDINEDTEAGVPLQLPKWFMDIVRICLSERPPDRASAKDLLKMFPNLQQQRLSLFGQEHVGNEVDGLPAEVGVHDDIGFENGDVVMESSRASSPVLGAGDEEHILRNRDAAYLDGRERERMYFDSASSISTDYGQEREGIYIEAAPSVDTGYESSTTWVIPRGRKGTRDSDHHGQTDAYRRAPVDTVYGNDHFVECGDGRDVENPVCHSPGDLDANGHIVHRLAGDEGHTERNYYDDLVYGNGHVVGSSHEPAGDHSTGHFPDAVDVNGHVKGDMIDDDVHDHGDPHQDHIVAVPDDEPAVGNGEGAGPDIGDLGDHAVGVSFEGAHGKADNAPGAKDADVGHIDDKAQMHQDHIFAVPDSEAAVGNGEGVSPGIGDLDDHAVGVAFEDAHGKADDAPGVKDADVAHVDDKAQMQRDAVPDETGNIASKSEPILLEGDDNAKAAAKHVEQPVQYNEITTATE